MFCEQQISILEWFPKDRSCDTKDYLCLLKIQLCHYWNKFNFNIYKNRFFFFNCINNSQYYCIFDQTYLVLVSITRGPCLNYCFKMLLFYIMLPHGGSSYVHAAVSVNFLGCWIMSVDNIVMLYTGWLKYLTLSLQFHVTIQYWEHSTATSPGISRLQEKTHSQMWLCRL